MLPFFRLIRIKNLAIVVLTMLSMRYGIIEPILNAAGQVPAMPLLDYWLMITATVLFGAAGYVINDYFDQKIDMINKPDIVVIGKNIHRRKAILIHYTFNSIGLLLAIVLTYRLRMWWIIIVYFLVTAIFWFYSTWLKKHAFLSTFSVALLAFFVPFQVVLFEWAFGRTLQLDISDFFRHSIAFNFITKAVFAYSVFAFITNFIRETAKDLEDIRGDVRYGRRTLPITLGAVNAKWMVNILTGLVIISIAAIYFIFAYNSDTYKILGLYLIVFCITPLIMFIVTTTLSKEAKQYKLPGNLMKAVMFFGIILCFLLKYGILH